MWKCRGPFWRTDVPFGSLGPSFRDSFGNKSSNGNIIHDSYRKNKKDMESLRSLLFFLDPRCGSKSRRRSERERQREKERARNELLLWNIDEELPTPLPSPTIMVSNEGKERKKETCSIKAVISSLAVKKRKLWKNRWTFCIINPRSEGASDAFSSPSSSSQVFRCCFHFIKSFYNSGGPSPKCHAFSNHCSRLLPLYYCTCSSSVLIVNSWKDEEGCMEPLKK